VVDLLAHGIGLSRDHLRQRPGSLKLDASALGGLRVEVVLPRAQA